MPFCKHYTKINEFKVSDLELLKKADFEEFLAHISKFGAVSKEEIKSSIETGKYITESKPATEVTIHLSLMFLFMIKYILNHSSENFIILMEHNLNGML